MKCSITILLIIVLTGFLQAQWVRTNYPGNDRINSMAVSGDNIFVGTSDDGIYLSTDNGFSWALANNGLTYHTPVNAIGLKPNNAGNNDIFAGTYKGVYISTDEGSTWKATAVDTNGLPIHEDVHSLVIQNNNIFISTSEGVFLSTNNGADWISVNSGLPYARLGINEKHVFASTGSKVLRSTTDGFDWIEITNGFPEDIYISALAVTGDNIYAGTYNGVYLSTNNGANWSNIGTGISYYNPGAINSFAFKDDIIFAGTSYGIFLSTNKGSSWIYNNIDDSSPKVTQIYTLVIKGDTIFAGTDDGVWYCKISELVPNQNLPLVVDNSDWFPPAENQYWDTCTIFSTIYYLKSYIWNRKFQRNPLLEQNQFSPYFVSNQYYGPSTVGSQTGQMQDIFPLVANQGCVTLDKYPLDNHETLPSLELRESGLSYRSSKLTSVRISYPDSMIVSDILTTLKDSLNNGTCFTIEFPIYGYMRDLYNKPNAVYSCFKDISPDSIQAGHQVAVVGYNDTIKTATGHGAFKCINSWGSLYGDDGFFYLDYNWYHFTRKFGTYFAYFLEEEFNYTPELTLNFNLILEINNEYRNNNIFTDTVYIDNNGKRFDTQDIRNEYVNSLRLKKINGQTIPAVVEDNLTNNLIYLPPYSHDGYFQVMADLTKYVKAHNFKSLEMLVCDPVSVSYTGIVPDPEGNYSSQEKDIYSYTRQPKTQINDAYIKFLDLGSKQLIGKTIELSDTTVNCYNYYSSQLQQLINPPINNRVFVTKSVSTFKRKLVVFDIEDTSVVSINHSPVFVNKPDTLVTYQDSTISFQFKAEDPDGDKLSYSINRVEGAQIDSSTGLFTFNSNQLGNHNFYITVTDGKDEIIDSFVVKVVEKIDTTNSNLPPYFISKPDTLTTSVDSTITFQFKVEDPNGDELLFFVYGDVGAEIDSVTGLFTYKSGEPGIHKINILVTDGKDTIVDSFIVRVDNIVGVETQYTKTIEFALFQNYPNPFNPTTKITYSIPTRSYVTLKIYDILGNEIATLVNEEKSSGIYEINFDANRLSSGIYFYRISTGSYTAIKKFVLVK